MKQQSKQVFLEVVTQVWCRGPQQDPQSYYFPNRARALLSLSFSVRAVQSPQAELLTT